MRSLITQMKHIFATLIGAYLFWRFMPDVYYFVMTWQYADIVIHAIIGYTIGMIFLYRTIHNRLVKDDLARQIKKDKEIASGRLI